MIAGNDRLLGSLFRAVSGQPPLDCVRAGYFARLVGTLLTRCGEDVLAFLEVDDQPCVLQGTLCHGLCGALGDTCGGECPVGVTGPGLRCSVPALADKDVAVMTLVALAWPEQPRGPRGACMLQWLTRA